MHILLSDKVTPDNIVDGYASGMNFHTEEFILGILVGIVISFFVLAIISAIKTNIIDCGKDSNEDEKSDE